MDGKKEIMFIAHAADGSETTHYTDGTFSCELNPSTEVSTGYCQVEEPEGWKKEAEAADSDALFEARMNEWLSARGLTVVKQVDVEDGKVGEKSHPVPEGPSTPRGLSVVAENPMGARMGTACWKGA